MLDDIFINTIWIKIQTTAFNPALWRYQSYMNLNKQEWKKQHMNSFMLIPDYFSVVNKT